MVLGCCRCGSFPMMGTIPWGGGEGAENVERGRIYTLTATQIQLVLVVTTLGQDQGFPR